MKKVQKKVNFYIVWHTFWGGGTPTLELCKVPVHFHTTGTSPYDIILRIISR